MKNKLLFIVVVILLFVSCTTSKKITHGFKKNSNVDSFFKGFVVYDTKTDKEIVNYNGAKYFTPASNVKLFTFYTAYRTFRDSVIGLEYAQVKDSLIIKGTADPSFLYNFEGDKTINFLRNTKQNIYLVNTKIDDSVFGNGWSWDDYVYGFMAEKSIFPMYGNVISLSKYKQKVDVNPSYFKSDVQTKVTTRLRREVGENIFYVSSSKNINGRHIPFKTSSQLNGALLADVLRKKVVLVPERIHYNFKPFYSIAYDSLYTRMLQKSDNFIAEQLLLQVGKEIGGRYNTQKAIDFSLKNYLQDLPQKPRWVDGSGLSRYNLFTPESMVFVLRKMYKEIPKKKLLSYFPVGGKTGTIKNNFKNEQAYIYAKSGSLSNNYCLSGYLITKKENVLIFSYMNNHFKGNNSEIKKEMEVVLKQLYENY